MMSLNFSSKNTYVLRCFYPEIQSYHATHTGKPQELFLMLEPVALLFLLVYFEDIPIIARCIIRG